MRSSSPEPQDGGRPSGLLPGLPRGAEAGKQHFRVAGAAGKLSLGQLGSGSDLPEKVGTRSEGAAQENPGDSQAWRGSWGCSGRRAVPLSH